MKTVLVRAECGLNFDS